MPDLRTAAQELLDAASKITLAPYRKHDDLTATSRFEKARKTLEALLTGQQDSGVVIAAKDVDGPIAPEWALGRQDPAIEEAISLLRELARELRGHYSPDVKELPPQLAAVGSVCSDLERLRVLPQQGEDEMGLPRRGPSELDNRLPRPQQREPDSDGDVVISARIPHEDLEALQARAKAADRTFSGELRRVIRSYLPGQQGEPDEPTLFEAWDAGWKHLLFEDWRADWRAARENRKDPGCE